MAYEVDGKVIETNEKGYLVEPNDWNEKVAEIIAAEEKVDLGEKHYFVALAAGLPDRRKYFRKYPRSLRF